MKKMICCLLAAVAIMGTVGCTGPFKLTKKIHAWHTGMEDKWVQEIAFLGVVILPVYFFGTLGDAIIFNSIEFWGGENPVATVTNGDENVKMTKNEDGSILVEGENGSFVLKKSRYGVSAYDTEGNLLYISHTGEDNNIRVYDADGAVVASNNS